MVRRTWARLVLAMALLLVLEGEAHASGQGGAILVLAAPALVAFFLGFLGLGLLLVDKQHRRLFVGFYLACMLAAMLLSSWLPAVVVGVIALLPVIFALWDKGEWKAVAVAALATPLLLWGYRQLMFLTFHVSIYLVPLTAAIPLLPFVVACWQSGRKKLALASVPVFVAGSYLFMLWVIVSW